jgi:hypothetical protein
MKENEMSETQHTWKTRNGKMRTNLPEDHEGERWKMEG